MKTYNVTSNENGSDPIIGLAVGQRSKTSHLACTEGDIRKKKATI